MHCVLCGFYRSVLFPRIGRAGTPTTYSLELTIGRIGRNMILLQSIESSIRVGVMQFYVYAVAIISEGRRISAQAGRPRLDSARPPASAVWKSEVGRASDRPFSPPMLQMQSLCPSDSLPGSVTLPVAQQSPGSWEREQIRHRQQNLGDVDHGLTNKLHAMQDGPYPYVHRIQPHHHVAVCHDHPVMTRRAPNPGSQEARRWRGAWSTAALECHSISRRDKLGQDRHGLDLSARLVG